jgi:DNA-binding MarR family transcriptional regulator
MLDVTRERPAAEAPFGGMDDVYTKPGHLIRRLQQMAVSVFTRECADHDITPVQYAALVAVRDNPELDATRIAALIAFDRSTLGNVLERLEAKGLIERRAKAGDRRVKILRLSTRCAGARRGRARRAARAEPHARSVERSRTKRISPARAPHHRATG